MGIQRVRRHMSRANRLAQLNPGVDEKTLAKAAAIRDESAIAQKRARTGGAFQQQLRGTHENYLNRGWGLVLEQHPPFVRTKNGWVPRGVGRCDYAGHVNISPKPVADGYARRIEPAGSPAASGTPMPVYFDAKVLGREHATYTHLVRDQHQLIDLKAALRAGGYAFLLVHAPLIERAFVIGIAEHFDELMRGRGVTLWRNRAWSEARNGWLFEPLLPSCEWSAAIGWHWAPQLRFIQRGEAHACPK